MRGTSYIQATRDQYAASTTVFLCRNSPVLIAYQYVCLPQQRSTAMLLCQTKSYLQMVQIWTVVTPSCLLDVRLWKLTRASVALTSQALLASSVSTVKYLKHARRTTLSTNGEAPGQIVDYFLEQDRHDAVSPGVSRCFQQQYRPGIVLQYMKKATSGKMGVSLAFFTEAMCRYMKDICDKQVSEARKYNTEEWFRYAASLLISNSTYNHCEMLGRCAVHGCSHSI